jgi:hypothetical protein
MIRHLLAVVGYVVATFLVQGLSHFVVFKSHYDSISFAAAQPVFALGLLSMVIQGSVLSFVFVNSKFSERGLAGAVLLGWLFGAFLVSYEAFAEAAKYTVPDMMSWALIEVASGAVQYTLVGLALGLAHRKAM